MLPKLPEETRNEIVEAFRVVREINEKGEGRSFCTSPFDHGTDRNYAGANV